MDVTCVNMASFGKGNVGVTLHDLIGIKFELVRLLGDDIVKFLGV